MSGPALSVVVPVFDEVQVIDELVERCLAALAATGLTYELILVDDRSTDGTSERIAEIADGERVVHHRMSENMGQFPATRAGLAASRGDRVIVLDGDLQDPPEVITQLASSHDPQETDVVFAVKESREDPLLFRHGRAHYEWLTRLGMWTLPSGAGSYCSMTREMAHRVARVPLDRVNLAPVLGMMRIRWDSVSYRKGKRYDGRSRVGLWGLLGEAFGSLVIMGVAERLLMILLVIQVLGAITLTWTVDGGMEAVGPGPVWTLSAVLAIGFLACRRVRIRVSTRILTGPHMGEGEE